MATDFFGRLADKKERKKMNSKFRRAASDLRSYRASKYSSYRPYGSDDGYDYERDNRDGSVDDYIEFVKEWRKNRDTTKSEG